MENYKAIKVNGGKIDEHRHIMQKKLGRKLQFNEVVHHLDGDKSNNSLKNLRVMSRSEHSRLHQSGNSLKESTKEKIKFIARRNRTSSKLSDTQIHEIRRMLSDGLKVSEIAMKFSVSRYAIYRIKNNQAFSYVK